MPSSPAPVSSCRPVLLSSATRLAAHSARFSPRGPADSEVQVAGAEAAALRPERVFDANSLGIVLLDALERRAAEEIFSRNAQGARGTRLSSMQKVELVGQITGWFFSSEQVAYQVLKELGRACQKERHIVASIPEDQAAERVGSYRAIAFKRERAKLVWALVRDERPLVRKLASRVGPRRSRPSAC